MVHAGGGEASEAVEVRRNLPVGVRQPQEPEEPSHGDRTGPAHDPVEGAGERRHAGAERGFGAHEASVVWPGADRVGIRGTASVALANE